MGFDINNSVAKQLTLQDLTSGLDKVKDKKKIDRITQIFNKYNTNNDAGSAGKLDIDEQVSIMNAYHKADGDNDGHINRKSLRNAGFKGEYKAYRDFMEAYQKAVGESVNTYELKFKDDTIDGKAFTQTSATQAGETVTVKHEYINMDGEPQKLKSTYSGDDGIVSYNPKGQMLRQAIDDQFGERTVLKYNQYDSDAANAKPGVISVRTGDITQTLNLQEDGTYLDNTDNSYYRLNNKMLLDEFKVDDKNRVTSEVWGEHSFEYTYANDDTHPFFINVDGGENSSTGKTYDYSGKENIYSTGSGESREYYKFDAEKRTFTKTEAPKPDVVKPKRPTERHRISMTKGWKDQKVNPDDAQTAKFNGMSTAQEVLDELMSGKFKSADYNPESLLADLIKNNPSVFNKDGVIYSDAIWQNLDFPEDLTAYNEFRS